MRMICILLVSRRSVKLSAATPPVSMAMSAGNGMDGVCLPDRRASAAQRFAQGPHLGESVEVAQVGEGVFGDVQRFDGFVAFEVGR